MQKITDTFDLQFLLQHKHNTEILENFKQNSTKGYKMTNHFV